MIIGAHLSIAKGMPVAIDQAQSIGANAFQFFTRNPRGGKARDIPVEEMEEFQTYRISAGIKYVVGHMPYTINLATNRPDIHRFGMVTLLEDLRRFNEAGVEHLVLHPGSHLGDGPEAGIVRIAEALTYVFDNYQGQTRLLLETMAGQGTEIGSSFDELEAIFRALDWPDEMGLGLDSCHLFAAGYDITTDEGLDRIVDLIDKKLGWHRVGMMHLNDSKQGLGSGSDRHEKIGQGMIGLDGIATIINHPVFGDLPFVLETPVKDYSEYGEEIQVVRQLRKL
ncbi:MAG: deoxyribonuclease IV [Firmicutes bacterium]|mgnify:CR=1 FL=1|nr:deoxyribonuclease IV [Bacillota bacterium]